MSDSHDPVSRRCHSGASPAWQIWTVRIASLFGLFIAGYLLYQAMTGAGVAGCGEAASCAEVLASRWSKIGPIPVSGPAVVVYLIIFVQSLYLGPARPNKQREGVWRVIVFFGTTAALAALWFIGLQLFVVGKICYYCMAAHACSLIIGGVALLHGPRKLFPFAIAGVAIMIAAQVIIAPPPPAPMDETQRFMFDPQVEPMIGNPQAPVVIGFLFDYNCGHCAEVHRQLREATARYGDQIAVVMLPTAINPACNRHVGQMNRISEYSCEIARLALAVFRADPEQFSAFDRFIMEQIPRVRREGRLPETFVAEVLKPEAERLVGVQALDTAIGDPWVDSRLVHAATVYHRTAHTETGQSGVPRLIVGGLAYPGTGDEAALFELLEKTYSQLRPAGE